MYQPKAKELYKLFITTPAMSLLALNLIVDVGLSQVREGHRYQLGPAQNVVGQKERRAIAVIKIRALLKNSTSTHHPKGDGGVEDHTQDCAGIATVLLWIQFVAYVKELSEGRTT